MGAEGIDWHLPLTELILQIAGLESHRLIRFAAGANIWCARVPHQDVVYLPE